MIQFCYSLRLHLGIESVFCSLCNGWQGWTWIEMLCLQKSPEKKLVWLVLS